MCEEAQSYNIKVCYEHFDYLINEEEKTASLINYNYHNNRIFDETIPRSVNFNSTEYIITSILNEYFMYGSILSLTFAPDSEIRVIKKGAFSKFNVKSISFPSTIEEINDEFCTDNEFLNQVEINNPYYISHEGKFIFGKTSKDQENYNVLIFSAKDVEEVIIPSFIEIIKEHAFEGCLKLRTVKFERDSKLRIIEKNAFKKTTIENITIPPHITQIETGTFSMCQNLRSIEFSENSELRIIKKNAFSDSAIEFISIPQNLIELEEGWCNQTPKLTKIEIHPLNKNYKIIENGKIIIGKTSKEQENFDSLVFCSRDLKELTIPDSITKIMAYSFSDCSIEKVKISPIVKEIGQKAFSNCEHIQKVEIPKNSQIELINECAFEKSSIDQLYFPSSLVNLKKGWCSFTSKLTKIEIDPTNPCYKIYDNKIVIGKSSKEKENFDVLVFAPRDIKEVTIPSFIEIIDESSFLNCSQLQNVKFSHDSKLRIIGKNAFYNCFKLKKVEFPSDSKIEIIGDYAFAQTPIESFTIPSKVKKICSHAFFRCIILSNIEIHEDSQLENIGDFAFSETSIQSIFIPQHVVEIRNNAFESCKELEIVEFSENSELKIIDEKSFYNTSIKKIKIPIQLQEIRNYSFSSCSKLEIVEIPSESELRIIGIGSFISCPIKTISIPKKLKHLCDSSFENCTNLENVIIPRNSELQIIGSEAFLHSRIKSILIPSKMKIIKDRAFLDCNFLSQVEITKDSELEIIGQRAFENLKIESIIIPSQVKYIGSYAFSCCRDLKGVDLSSILNPLIIDEPCFLLCTKLEKIDINPNNQYLKIYDDKLLIRKSSPDKINYDVLVICFNNENKVTIPNFIEIISQFAFKNCNEIKSIEIPDDSKLRIISKSSFSGSSIESITIPSTTTHIESYAFYENRSLSTIKISSDSNLQIINNFAFYQSKITSITIPSQLKKIGFKAFKKCSNLKEIHFLPNSNLITIDEQAFARTSIESFTVPPKLIKFGYGIFYFCQCLKSFIIPENSLIETIPAGFFADSLIESLSILNTKLNKLKSGWCNDCFYLSKIEINPKNPYFKMYDNKLLIGRSSNDKENFDSLIFCLRKTKFHVTIPNFIEIIKRSAFQYCDKIQKIIFQPDSKLKIIKRSAFSYMKIKEFDFLQQLTYVGDYAFYNDTELKKVKIPENSNIQEIGDGAFEKTSVNSFYFPSKIRKIGKSIFSDIQIVEFAENSEIKYTDLEFCNTCYNLIIMMPSKMSDRIFNDKTFGYFHYYNYYYDDD